jgi:hypothetical protein
LVLSNIAEEARSFLSAVGEAQAPAVWEAELANVLWMATRQKVLTIQDAISRLTLAGSPGNSYRSEPNSLAGCVRASARIGYRRL